MAVSDAEKAAEFVLSPLGGAAFAAFLLPTGCTDIVPLGGRCPAGEETNFLGWTVFGIVGTLDNAGLFALGVVAALVVYLVISSLPVRGRRDINGP